VIDAGSKSLQTRLLSGRKNTWFASLVDTVRSLAMESRSNAICAKLASLNSLALSAGASNRTLE